MSRILDNEDDRAIMMGMSDDDFARLYDTMTQGWETYTSREDGIAKLYDYLSGYEGNMIGLNPLTGYITAYAWYVDHYVYMGYL